MTRVLFATRAWESLEIEGGYLLLRDIARQLSAYREDEKNEHKFEACFFSVRDGEESGITLFRAFRESGWSATRRIEFFLALLKYLPAVDVVHFAHTPTLLNSLFIRSLKRLYPAVTFVQTITGFVHQDRGCRSLYWGDAVATISPRVATYVLDQHGIVADLITPHPRPERLAGANPLPPDLDLAFGKNPLIVFPIDVFRLNLQEFDVASVCRKLLARIPELQFVFLDRFGDEIRIRESTSDLPADQVHFLPIIDYMGSLIRRADVIAFPMSDVNGKFNPPMVLLEAMHHHRPVVCSDNIDLPGQHWITKVSGWDCDDWSHAVYDALGPARPNAPSSKPVFERNCYRYINLYRSDLPVVQAPAGNPLSLRDFIKRLESWAQDVDLPVFFREGGLDDADYTGAHDMDIWVRAVDSSAIGSFLKSLAATRVIRRRATCWTSQDVYVVRLAEGNIQLDVGIGRIASGNVSYASLNDFAGGSGLVRLPDDVEIFSQGMKQQMRGITLTNLNLRSLVEKFVHLDERARIRLGQFFQAGSDQLPEYFTGEVSPQRIPTLFAAAIRRSRRQAARHPAEYLRVIRAKLSIPFWPRPFGRRVKGQIIAIIGTDGSGKSTAQETLLESLARDGYRPRYVYMGRARGNIVVSDKLKEKAENAYRKSRGSWLKYVASWVYVFDYFARFAKIYFLSRVRGETILCDRYFFDIRLMENYSKIGYRLLALVAPKPDILAVLDCTVATLMDRKAERTPEEYEKQRQFYLQIVADAKVRFWRGTLNTDVLDGRAIESIVSGLNYRASHRGYDY